VAIIAQSNAIEALVAVSSQAVEQAEDVAVVYAQADEQTKTWLQPSLLQEASGRSRVGWGAGRDGRPHHQGRAEGALCSSSGREAGARGARRGRADPLRPLERRARPRRVGL